MDTLHKVKGILNNSNGMPLLGPLTAIRVILHTINSSRAGVLLKVPLQVNIIKAAGMHHQALPKDSFIKALHNSRAVGEVHRHHSNMSVILRAATPRPAGHMAAGPQHYHRQAMTPEHKLKAMLPEMLMLCERQ